MKNLIIIGVVLVIVILGGYFLMSQTSAQSTPIGSFQPDQGTQDQVSQNMVVINNFAFSPQVLTVKQGTTVTWVNQDTVAHSIKSATFNSQSLNQGETFSFTFNTKGTFDYSCGIHPSMTGQIVVE